MNDTFKADVKTHISRLVAQRLPGFMPTDRGQDDRVLEVLILRDLGSGPNMFILFGAASDRDALGIQIAWSTESAFPWHLRSRRVLGDNGEVLPEVVSASAYKAPLEYLFGPPHQKWWGGAVAPIPIIEEIFSKLVQYALPLFGLIKSRWDQQFGSGGENPRFPAENSRDRLLRLRSSLSDIVLSRFPGFVAMDIASSPHAIAAFSQKRSETLYFHIVFVLSRKENDRFAVDLAWDDKGYFSFDLPTIHPFDAAGQLRNDVVVGIGYRIRLSVLCRNPLGFFWAIPLDMPSPAELSSVFTFETGRQLTMKSQRDTPIGSKFFTGTATQIFNDVISKMTEHGMPFFEFIAAAKRAQ